MAMHWHPNADEWRQGMSGFYELIVFAAKGKASVNRLREGDVGDMPMGYGHALRNGHSTPTDVLVVFSNGTYQSINLG